MAADGRRCSSGGSYSRAAMVKVVAMLLPTMSAIASQNSTKILMNRLCMRQCEGVARTTDILDLRIVARLEFKFAAQITDMRVDAAVVCGELAPQGLFCHRLPRYDLAGRAHEQFEHAKLGAGQCCLLARHVNLPSAGVQSNGT